MTVSSGDDSRSGSGGSSGSISSGIAQLERERER